MENWIYPSDFTSPQMGSGTWRSPFSLWSFTLLKQKPGHCLLTESSSLLVSSSRTEEPSSAAKMSVRRQRPKQIHCITGLSSKSCDWMNTFWKPVFPRRSQRVQTESCVSPVEARVNGTKIWQSPLSTQQLMKLINVRKKSCSSVIAQRHRGKDEYFIVVMGFVVTNMYDFTFPWTSEITINF